MIIMMAGKKERRNEKEKKANWFNEKKLWKKKIKRNRV